MTGKLGGVSAQLRLVNCECGLFSKRWSLWEYGAHGLFIIMSNTSYHCFNSLHILHAQASLYMMYTVAATTVCCESVESVGQNYKV